MKISQKKVQKVCKRKKFEFGALKSDSIDNRSRLSMTNKITKLAKSIDLKIAPKSIKFGQ